jgi:hypothetical protein
MSQIELNKYLQRRDLELEVQSKKASLKEKFDELEAAAVLKGRKYGCKAAYTTSRSQ